MTTLHNEVSLRFARWKNSAWTMLGMAVVSFAAGIFISCHLTHVQDVKAEVKLSGLSIPAECRANSQSRSPPEDGRHHTSVRNPGPTLSDGL
jgi:hypothetical protein